MPLPAGHPWRIVDLREGNGIRHEDYIRGQGTEDYRDRILVQRLQAQELNPETYLAHVSAGLRAHCADFTTSGLVPAERDGLPSATLTAYCGRFEDRPYGYIIAHKAIRDGDHMFVVAGMAPARLRHRRNRPRQPELRQRRRRHHRQKRNPLCPALADRTGAAPASLKPPETPPPPPPRRKP